MSLRSEFEATLQRTKMQCTVDAEMLLELGMYDDCVLDANDPESFEKCDYCKKGMKKEDCEYWQEITFTRAYNEDDIWEWLDDK